MGRMHTVVIRSTRLGERSGEGWTSGAQKKSPQAERMDRSGLDVPEPVKWAEDKGATKNKEVFDAALHRTAGCVGTLDEEFPIADAVADQKREHHHVIG